MELSERALQRRLKRHLLKEPQRYLAVCTPGFEAVLDQEIRGLPSAEVSQRVSGGVEFTGPLDTIYHANLWLRTANRVLLRLGDFLAQSYPMLYDRARKLPWELYLGFAEKVAVRVSARSSRLRHKLHIGETVHAALLQRLEPLGLKPALDQDAPTQVFVRMFEDRATLSLNTSGEHLHRRGYRQDVTSAPIRETLAAAVLLSAGLGPAAPGPASYDLLLDPMCGSGTFPIEAALISANIAPGRSRAFAFEGFPFFQAGKWDRFKREAASAATGALRIIGADLDPAAIAVARANARRAGIADCITFITQDLRTLISADLAPESSRPLLTGNLPYGRRLGTRSEARRLATDLCERLRACCPGSRYALVSAEPGWLEGCGSRHEHTLHFVNGGQKVSLVLGRVE